MCTWARVCSAWVCVVASACGGSNPAVAPTSMVISPTDLYPLRSGNAWSYYVDTGESTHTLAITRVEALHGPIAIVRTGNSSVKYELREEGIYVTADNAWLFRLPFEEGKTWPARGGRTGRLISTQARVETPAGTFEGCLEVVETGGERELEVRTIYCPFVGPVAVDSTMRSDVSSREVSVRARLRGYDVEGGVSLNR